MSKTKPDASLAKISSYPAFWEFKWRKILFTGYKLYNNQTSKSLTTGIMSMCLSVCLFLSLFWMNKRQGK